MPCAPKMRGCRADCLHRALVEQYQDTRHAWESLRESDVVVPAAFASGGEGVAMHQLEDDDFREAFPAPTFKARLQGSAGARSEPS